mgnify:CR=1 FL=1
MRYQTYVLHLIDGTAIPMVEDYDLPAEKGIVGTSPKQPQTRFLPWATGCWFLCWRERQPTPCAWARLTAVPGRSW